MTQSKVDIVLVTWGRQKLTEMVLNSIKKNTKRDNYRLIVINNYYDRDMEIMLGNRHNLGEIDILECKPSNVGLEPARNQGLAHCYNEYMVCLDNDLLCPPQQDGEDWVEWMVDLMDHNPKYAAIAMRTQIMIGTGNIFDGYEDDDIVEFPHPGGSYRIMRTQLVKDVGGWRDNVNSRGSEEKHICSKLREAGYKTGFAVDVKSLHLFGDKYTDNWGYSKDMSPEDSGHSSGVWHPIFDQGDDPEQIKHFMETGEYE